MPDPAHPSHPRIRTEPGSVANPYHYTILLEYDGSHNLVYLGRAIRESLTSEPNWQIEQFTYSGTDLVSIKLASTQFDTVWDNRAGLTYA